MKLLKLVTAIMLSALYPAITLEYNGNANIDCGVYTNHVNNTRLLYKDMGCEKLEDSAKTYFVKDHCVCSFFKDECVINDTLLVVRGPLKGDIKDPITYMCVTAG